MPQTRLPHPARTSAAISAVVNARPGASLVAPGVSLLAIILALLLRILARAEAAWFLPEEDEEYDEYEDEYGFDAYAYCGADPYALHPRPVGSAPHAACIEAGLVPDWILPGIRNRGMRPAASPARKRRHARAARAPPHTPPSPRAENPLRLEGAYA